MEDATLCETADAAPASLGAASKSGAEIDQSLTCQVTEKRTRDEGAKLAPTFAQIKRARRAQSRAGGPGQCHGRAPCVASPGSHTEPTPSRSCVHLTRSLASADRIPYAHASTIPGAPAA